jgi:phosphatidylglycerol---prolipoprotein diacylglyceryl transferase
MQQVLFNIPFLKGVWIFPPDGIPIYGFGAMLFVTFILCTMWATRRGKAVGLPGEKTQDMVIWLFVAGIIGARVLYMIQYSHQFPNKDIFSLITAFFQIWKGGIIFYGSALGGVIGYALFYKYVLRKFNVSGWQLADAMAPVLALGLAIGRIGCFLNGCCWGQVAVEEIAPVPFGGAQYPLLPAHCRDDMVRGYGLQSSTGFTLVPRDRGAVANDPRSVVQFVEKDSPAEKAGLKPGDRIIGVNGKPNAAVLQVVGTGDALTQAWEELLKQAGASAEGLPEHHAAFDNPKDYEKAAIALDRPGVTLVDSDRLAELVRDWPRGRHDLELTVSRDGQEVALPPFAPRSVSLYPTQIYETVSMILLILLLLAYYPFRRHDGQLMVLCMVGYSIHRFIDESLRIEPAIGLGLTLSQWGSVVIFAGAVGIELYLRKVMPSRWVTPPRSDEPPG